ncbi:hypothetical protein SALBM135S_03293 [Streptomyces alboniger]
MPPPGEAPFSGGDVSAPPGDFPSESPPAAAWGPCGGPVGSPRPFFAGPARGRVAVAAAASARGEQSAVAPHDGGCSEHATHTAHVMHTAHATSHRTRHVAPHATSHRRSAADGPSGGGSASNTAHA